MSAPVFILYLSMATGQLVTWSSRHHTMNSTRSNCRNVANPNHSHKLTKWSAGHQKAYLNV